jgi:transposase
VRVVHERCCGLDVHKNTVVACAMTPQGQKTRTFGTVTEDLGKLARWLKELGIRHVAMESTGVYWVPVFNVLEEELSSEQLLVVNAQHIKAVPGRKTDVKDAEWIADLLRHGLVRGSFIPDRNHRELRELVRHRRNLINQHAQVLNRIQKVLEGANIKLASVASTIDGVSCREMLWEIVNGNQDPIALAGLARGRMKSKREELEKALSGTVRPHHRFMLSTLLRQYEFLTEEIAALDLEVAERMRPFAAALRLLDEVPGIGRRVAEAIIAELGTDMSRWLTHAHLASWAKLCPGNNQSGGKRRNARTGRGNSWLRHTLIEAARAAVRTKDSYLGAQYRRLKGRRKDGDNRAIIAVAHSILVIVYHMLRDGTKYQDLGKDFFRQHDREQITRRAVRTLKQLGYEVSLEEAVAA